MTLSICWSSGIWFSSSGSIPRRFARTGGAYRLDIPDPLEAVTTDLRLLFERDPSRTGREFLEEIQGTYPGLYPVSLLRTVQRRVKIWRHEMAKSLVLGPPKSTAGDASATDALRYVGTPRVSGTPPPAAIEG